MRTIQQKVINTVRMGNQLMEQCQGNNSRIEGFNHEMSAVTNQIILPTPSRSQQVEQTYQRLVRQKMIDYSLQSQKNSFRPIALRIFEEEGVYIGWVRSDKPHGPGQLYFHNHNYLQAIFKEGEVDCADAVFIEQNGSCYRGGFRNSKQAGQGVLQKGKDKIVANFQKGLPQGKGEKLFADGRIYRGQFKNGKMEGKGILQFKTKQIYEGYFREDLRNGVGKLETESYEYFGPFRNDIKEGKGTVIYKDGTKFEGWFAANRIQGYGEWHRPNGTIQKGNYSLPLPN